MNEPKKVKKTKKNFDGSSRSDASLLEAIADACRGLQFVSETDADIIPFSAPNPESRSASAYLKALDIDQQEFEERDFEKSFERLTAEKDWHGPREKNRSAQFEKLRKILSDGLKDLRVIRVGKIRIDIYIAGVSAGGNLLGVKTKAIET